MQKQITVWLVNNHVTGGHDKGGKTCLYTHFGGAKALFSYIHLQVIDSFGGKSHAKFFLLGAMPPVPPAGTCLVENYS